MATEYDVCPRCGKRVRRDDTLIESVCVQDGDDCMVCYAKSLPLPAIWYTYLSAKERRVMERQHGLQPYIPSANFSVQEYI